MKKMILFVVLGLIAGAMIAGFIIYSKYESYKKTPLKLENEITIEIDKGESWKKVADKLLKNGVISDKEKFYWMIREKKWGSKLKTGEYIFSGDVSPVDAAKTIMSGKVRMYSFTVPEGYNKYDTQLVFEQIEWMENSKDFLKVCNSVEFLKSIGYPKRKSCEGLLFPSTYSFAKGTDVKVVMKKMADELGDVLTKYKNEIKALDMTPYELLKLASIIEKETGVRKEQPMIASVFLNRRRIGMKMQTDPSVIYGFLPKFNGNITKKHLLTDHPWNTYTRYGFPVTPLCFMGESAIKSVLYPDKTSLLYFVATNKGYHYFSKTLKEHNAAVDHYQVKGLKSKFRY